jgi:hypothetical protein
MRHALIRINGTRKTLMRRRKRTNPPRRGGSLMGKEGLKRGVDVVDSNMDGGIVCGTLPGRRLARFKLSARRGRAPREQPTTDNAVRSAALEFTTPR